MTKRIFRSICLVAILVLLSAVVFIFGVLYEYFSILQHAELKEKLIFAAEGVENEHLDYLDSLSLSNTRITWIDKTGKVLYDTVLNADGLGEHQEREEIREAFESGYGESVRYSDSLLASQLYVAKRLSDGSVLRLSSPRASFFSALGDIWIPTAIILLGAILLSSALALGVSKKVVKPLNSLADDTLSDGNVYEELKPLYRRLAAQKKKLALGEAALKAQEDQFAAATESMSEGILLIGKQRRILSANAAALRFFSLGHEAIGRDITVIPPAFHIETILEEAESDSHTERLFHQGDNIYRLVANPILSEQKISGICLTIFDTTEKEKNEAQRREFTANVSHELKTPLHAISGYAELLSSGLVKEEDIPTFLHHIYFESGRMIRLIDDIIRLSSLDEGEGEAAKCDVDLFSVAKAVTDSLKERAEKHALTLTLDGESAVISGIPTLLTAIVSNLTTNAIKYNKENGYVKVMIQNGTSGVTLTVKDNGIGIAPEHHDRLFERFYRVDKSHSKAVGGTGLGLSIVKHAVKLHHGTITLQSVPNEGTEITVTFPKKGSFTGIFQKSD